MSQVEITKIHPLLSEKNSAFPIRYVFPAFWQLWHQKKKGPLSTQQLILREGENKTIFSYSVSSKVWGHSPAFSLIMNHWRLHLLTCNATSCFPACLVRGGCFCSLSWGHKRGVVFRRKSTDERRIWRTSALQIFSTHKTSYPNKKYYFSLQVLL